jgi:hypothetical protein
VTTVFPPTADAITVERASVTVVADAPVTVTGETAGVAVNGVVTSAAWLANRFALITDCESATLARVWIAGPIGVTVAALNFRYWV